jgi:hypothetical protein
MPDYLRLALYAGAVNADAARILETDPVGAALLADAARTILADAARIRHQEAH